MTALLFQSAIKPAFQSIAGILNTSAPINYNRYIQTTFPKP
ncbi:hypothetical protein HMPREF3156_01579 [Neisseria sp. HMSC06F02]|nr:hypothetical protein HMPREF3156_01579 [Neisseria sp. HMSC06F02]